MLCSPTRAALGVSSSSRASSETRGPSDAPWLCGGLPGEVTPLCEPKGAVVPSRAGRVRGCSSGWAVAATEGQISHPQPCPEHRHCQESLDPAGVEPRLWFML